MSLENSIKEGNWQMLQQRTADNHLALVGMASYQLSDGQSYIAGKSKAI